MIAEKTELREKNEILFKLEKVYLEGKRSDHGADTKNTSKESREHVNSDVIKIDKDAENNCNASLEDNTWK